MCSQTELGHLVRGGPFLESLEGSLGLSPLSDKQGSVSDSEVSSLPLIPGHVGTRTPARSRSHMRGRLGKRRLTY